MDKTNSKGESITD